LFDRFYRPVASRSLPGSGLGLAIVKDVAEANGGRVYVVAREGGGSVFGIAWPPLAD
ncbi:MAG: HAMP domain-containing histidine kinase, partial [Actinobacteria bacterium]